ncbi:glycosyltransferase [Flavobacterium sp. RHBU_24]|uniref:glycosyltransferase family protein n=1 Tax=Flavobacterium sp. RHBU_24 TaxID=3391185 RepID=UPI003984D75E
MKILLVGEYSRLHNSLKEGLEALGHTAVIVSPGDGFKGYASGLSVSPALFKNGWLKKFKNGVYKLTGADLERWEKGIRFYRLLPKLKGYDHVQLINSDALETPPWLAKRLLQKLFAQNADSMSLLVCGDETPVIAYNLSGKIKYSVLTPYFKDKSLKNYYSYSLKYLTKPHRDLFAWIAGRANAIITSDLDYELPMQAMGYPTHFIPNPINTEAIAFSPLSVTGKVVIFLGINRLSYTKKGIHYFEQALEIIRHKYPDKVEIIITENIPYAEYINLYNRAHILLDQVYAYDQGYNALEAMAKGKVVFTGAETEFTAHYHLTEPVNINALPNANAIADALSHLIENPDELIAIGKRASAFIEKEHEYKMIAARYVEVWGKKKLKHFFPE